MIIEMLVLKWNCTRKEAFMKKQQQAGVTTSSLLHLCKTAHVKKEKDTSAESPVR